MPNPLDANPDFEINNEEIEGLLKDLGHYLGDKMPAGWGFMLNIFSFGPNGSTFYISNARREDMISSLQELIANLERTKKS